MARRGLQLFGLVFLLILLAVGGVFLWRLAGESGRSSQWFTHAQIAHNLAEAALADALGLIGRANSRAESDASPLAAGPLAALFDALAAGSTATPVVLIDGADGATVSVGLQELLTSLDELGPRLRVEARLVASEPLGAVAPGLPAVPEERRGRIQLLARASVAHRLGLRVERTVVLEQSYKLVHVLPPLLGRFALFAAGPDGTALACVTPRFDYPSGDAPATAGPQPLVVEAGPVAELVTEGSPDLDRSRIASVVAGPGGLDGRGWIYLGGTEPWVLRLAHGHSGTGESFLLPGENRRALFDGTPAGDQAFRQRYGRESSIGGQCEFTLDGPADGLYHFHHGFAEGYRECGIDAVALRRLRDNPAWMDFGPGKASGLRLFGTPARASPALVFGPVEREYLRRASVTVTLGPDDYRLCFRPGRMDLTLFRIEDHQPATRTLLERSFAGADGYARFGTGLAREPYVAGLPLLLSVQGSGRYEAGGFLRTAPGGTPAPAGAPVPGTAAVPGLATIPPPAEGAPPLPAEAVDALRAGRVAHPEVFTGELANGLEVFKAALEAKATFRVPARLVTERLVAGDELRVPGIVLVDEATALSLPAIAKVVEGGILVARAGLELTGDIVRGGPEPLTLVSLEGDIVIGDGVRKLEAHLVALGGKVLFGSSPLEVVGGVSAKVLDMAAVANSPAARTVRYAPDMDPAVPAQRSAALRVFYGGATRYAVAGGGDP